MSIILCGEFMDQNDPPGVFYTAATNKKRKMIVRVLYYYIVTFPIL